ncbi:MAG TPA: MSMEG_4193 family putative phosphomutase [Aggregatilineales bacterium]|nr:MSMEG_4193 family putative phosphomutase [Chloroflexota bacterium]HOA22699.1 MSMEG_4193 family putative phosphomutase [Aggregatilineales bacterium]HPV06608.1 MSMEG_4193 family putative phosphomutase [Aggregatilineales bacterium]HQA67572.1 MSMEG_4193 family putative phosphomutase [Aggregatilineales bacterium]HQE18603.1 MSMEG_4193 family putative phosphomutase [Aggregatilineales bacterium]
MTLLVLIRHAQNDWVKTGRLAGWTPGVHLNEEGRRQAEALGERLASAKLQAVYSSPLERAVETAEAVVKHYPGLTVQIEEGVGEVAFGGWTGERLRKLRRRRLWDIVQNYPSGARFPEGESFRETQNRVIDALERIAQRHPGGKVAVVSHSDVIKLAVAYYAGIHLDLFQRLIISPASISIIGLSRMGPRIIRLNDTAHYEQARRDRN